MLPTVMFSADDYGLHPQIDAGIDLLIQKQRIHATSVLITKNYSQDLSHLRDSGIAVGIHLAFTEVPALGPERFTEPWISNGVFLPHWRDLLRVLICKPLPVEVVSREWATQIEYLLRRIGRIDFLDSHQNIHLLPPFAPIVRGLLAEYKIRYVRVFYDPLKVMHPLYSALSLMGRQLYPAYMHLPTYGIFTSGEATADRIRKAVKKARHDQFAFMVHPGLSIRSGDPAAPRYTLNWKLELDTLLYGMPFLQRGRVDTASRG